MWQLLHPQATPEHLGFLPQIILADDPRPVSEQANERYAHGGGWNPYPSSAWVMNPDKTITYKGIETYTPIAKLHLENGERFYFYDHSIVAVIQAGGDFEVSRMD